MSDAKLWIDEVGCTATITGTNVSYTMPLWVLDVMRDIIVTEAEKKVEVTHRDFDIQQELLDRYKAENAKLLELAKRAWKAAEMLCKEWDGPCRADGVSIMTPCPMNERDELCVYGLIQRDMRELGIEVDA